MRNLDYEPTQTLPQIVASRALSTPTEVALQQWSGGNVKQLTWADYAEAVTEIGLGLAANGVRRGDRVAIMSSSRHEFPLLMLGAQSVGAVSLGIYPTSSAFEVSQILSHSEAVVVVGETGEHLDKISAALDETTNVKAVIGLVPVVQSLPADVVSMTLKELRARGAAEAAERPKAFAISVEAGSIDEPAALFYTSGTTGAPKGVTHTHSSLLHGARTAWALYPEADRERHDLVGFLPVAFVAPAIACVVTPLITRLVVTFCPIEDHMEAFRVVRPNAVVWVPRFYEKFGSAVLEHVHTSGPVKRWMYQQAMRVGRRVGRLRGEGMKPSLIQRALYAGAVRFVFMPIRAKVGFDRVRVAWTASAPMPPSVMSLWQIWGVDLREMYGLTETGGCLAGQFDTPFPVPGSIGNAYADPRWVLRRSDDGELLAKGPLLFSGYWKDPALTAAAYEDGWFKTGDLVDIDAEGVLRLVGRKKDIIITSGGKTISPQPIEVALKESEHISEVIVVGDSRKYLAVLIEVDHDAMVRRLGRDHTPDEVQELIAEDLRRVNAKRARSEQLRAFRILPRPLSIETGERTANGKMKRAGVLTSYAALIDDMYGLDEEANALSREAAAEDGRR